MRRFVLAVFLFGSTIAYAAPNGRPTGRIAASRLRPVVTFWYRTDAKWMWTVIFNRIHCGEGNYRGHQILLKQPGGSTIETNTNASWCNGRLLDYSGTIDFARFKDWANKGVLIDEFTGRAIPAFNEAGQYRFQTKQEESDFSENLVVAGSSGPLGPEPVQKGGRASGPPTATEVASVHAEASSRYSSSETSSTPGEEVFSAPNGEHQYYISRTIANLQCRPIATASFRCTYDMIRSAKAAFNSLVGRMTVAAMAGSSQVGRQHLTIDFSRSGDTWTSPSLTAAARQAATARAAARASARSGPVVDDTRPSNPPKTLGCRAGINELCY